ncbi:MAG: hypothetical protein MUO82_02280 [Candidatus Thermoplasmatota archaeon]|nr:hypothetical protein [Candidatus Thermoplasmatota archaeon]
MQILNEIYKQLYFERENRIKTHLYVTDLGFCPRRVMMDFGDFEKRDFTKQELYMFKKSKQQEVDFEKMLERSDNFFVLKHNLKLDDGLPPLWHGELDFFLYDREDKEFEPLEYKSSRSFKYPEYLPKRENVFQTKAYIYALKNMFPNLNIKRGILFYDDRSGSNLPLEFLIDNTDDLINEMKIYEDWHLKSILPPILEREIKQTKNEFYLIPNWQCGIYCKYHDLSCKPNMSKNKIAEIKDDKLVIRKDYFEYEDKLNEIIDPKDDKDFYNFCKRGGK